MLNACFFVTFGLFVVPQMEPDARVLGSKVKREDWTFEQDMVFEHAMAEFDETVSRHVLAASSIHGSTGDRSFWTRQGLFWPYFTGFCVKRRSFWTRQGLFCSFGVRQGLKASFGRTILVLV